VRTALESSTPSGWAEITHPFHPRRHQRFKVLKAKRISGVCILSLQDPSAGVFSIPREWTDLADPSAQILAETLPTILHLESLTALVKLLEELEPPRQEEKGSVP
jgi:hypothetical protein